MPELVNGATAKLASLATSDDKSDTGGSGGGLGRQQQQTLDPPYLPVL